MKHSGKYLLIALITLTALEGFAQNLSNRGREFWVGYGHHHFMETGSNSQEMVLYLSAEEAATVTVSVGNGSLWTRTYSVPANTVIATDYMPKAGPEDARLMTVPCSFADPGEVCGGVGSFLNKAIHIESSVPIVAYAHTFGDASSGASMLMPVETWGYSYVTLNSNQSYAESCFSWAYAIASHDNTLIEVTPSVPTRDGRVAGVPFTVTLNKGDVYQNMAGPETGSNKLHFSGTKIRSIANAMGDCYPIAVFSGSSRTSNQTSCGTGGGGDNDNQQCFPTQAWGKRYLTAPTSPSTNPSGRMSNMFRIAVKDPTTVVRRNGTPLTGLTAGTYYTYQSNTPDYIESDKPIMVAQYMSGASGCLTGGVGDPEMMYISPIEQGIRRTGFYRNDRENINYNYLTLIIPTGGIPSLRIDGLPTFDHSYAHPRLAGYSVVVKRWSAFQAQAIVSSDSAFTAITYGLGSVESYGYNAGTMINNLNAVGAIQNALDPQTPQHAFTCAGSPIKISALLAYQPTNIVWQFSALGGVVSPNADINQAAPVSSGTSVVNGITYYRYDLPGEYIFNAADTFLLPILTTHPEIENCYRRETLSIPIIVKEMPVADFNFTTSTACSLDTVYLHAQGATADGYTLESWQWSLPGGATATGKDTLHVFSAGAAQNVRLSVVTTEGCAAEVTKPITIYAPPVAAFSTAPVTICEQGSATFTPSHVYGGTAGITGFYWDFGNGNTSMPSTAAPESTVYNTYGNYTVKLVAKVSDLCISDTLESVINVYAKPVVDIQYPAGCLPADGIVQFTNNTSTPDGQAVNNHLWNFGDPNATPGNPNTSAVASPSHAYSSFGDYNITYSVMSAQGCVKDTVIEATFNLSPVFAYAPLPAICENENPVSVATATVTNGVPGTGVYSGPGTTAAGMFDPRVAGPGTHTITYTYTTTANCVESISQTVIVHPRPFASFSFNNTGCLPADGQVTFTNNSTIAGGGTLTWLWNFGDPNASAPNPNTSTALNPSHLFQEGNYDIRLQVTSADNCVKDTTINAVFALTPLLSYPALSPVCDGTAPVSVATASVTNGAAGTGTYSGVGVTPAGMFDPAIAGPGTHTITYTFNTTSGCTETITQTILVHAKPLANFTFDDPACLPTSGLVNFVNTSTIADAQTLTWAWNFDDPQATPGNPNTSTAQNPSHNFHDGSFNIRLTVTSSNGCVDTKTVDADFALMPLLTYTAIPAVCANPASPVSVANASVVNNVPGTGVYSGPGTTAAGMFDPAAAGAGTHTITYTFTSTRGCVETATQTVTVNPLPVVDFSWNGGTCLPANGQVQFNNLTTITGNGPLTWSWNFDDPAATPGNPNTSTAQAPSHNFGEGNFDISLTATSANGCVATVTKAVAFAVTPVLNFPALAAVCENNAPFSIATATVTNGINGTGVYSGPGTSANGNFDPAAAGAGVHTITYTFTTNGGCSQSITQTIAVNPRPVAAFATAPDICFGTTATLTSNVTIPSGNISSWNWDFGNGTTPSFNNGNPVTVNYAATGDYTVKLTAVSDQGCVSLPVQQVIHVRPLPVADFTVPTNICLPGGNAQFVNTSTIAGNGALTYTWNFGDGSGPSAATDPAHVYAVAGNYNVTVTATSAFGCTDVSDVKVVNDFYSKPVAAFTVTPAEICQGANTVFTDASTPAAQVTGWTWNFDDGRPPVNTQTPIRQFTNAGSYDVSLTVTNQAGCVSDPFILPVTVHLQPQIDAGRSFVVPQGTVLSFEATANSPSLTFQWTPAANLSDATILAPSLTATEDQVYTLTATGEFNCTASDFLTVKILKPVKVPNAFSPNGDGVHDKWLIPNLGDYPGCTVEVFNRYGQQVFASGGYGNPWDGRYKGTDVPVGVYYYVIRLENGFKPITGSLTIVR